MSKTCIVTGGAGFIGSALSAGLVQRFDRVIAFDSLLAQVHGDTPRPPELDPAVELYRADVREAQAWTALLDTVDAVDTVIDLAAETGTGQSLFSATRHTSVNVVGTSRMMDALAQTGKLPRQLLLTSSRAHLRRRRLAKRGGGDFLSRPAHGRAAGPPGPVGLPRRGISARQRRLDPAPSHQRVRRHQAVPGAPAQGLGRRHRHPGENRPAAKCVRSRAVPDQRLHGHCAPVCAHGQGRAVHSPVRGRQIVRDFVLIDDVRDAILAALDRDSAAGQTIDIGTGRMTTIADVAQVIARRYHAPAPHVSGDYRNGDVRCGACDGEPARAAAGFPGTARPGGRAEPAVPMDRRHPGRRLNYDRFPLASFGRKHPAEN